MEIRRLTTNEIHDFKSLIKIFKEVFENTMSLADDQQLSKILLNKDVIVFIVKIDGEVVGGLVSYVLHRYYQEKPVAYIYDLGIASAFQRRGLGHTLINELCEFCKVNGFSEVYVEAESDDPDAVGFYRKTQHTSELKAIHFSYSLDSNLPSP